MNASEQHAKMLREKYHLPETVSEQTFEFAREALALSHAIQTGVKFEMELNLNDAADPKHLRTGVNVAFCDQSALVMLLISKGLITEDEYFEARIDILKKEVLLYQERLTERMGSPVTLG
jgi:hypothetical protein